MSMGSASLPPFVHLKLHTAYSLCEGAVKIENLTKACIEKKLPACAITDTNNMFGVLDFAVQCSSNGIQPVIGTLIDISFSEIYAPIVLIAKNECGYKSLLKLMTDHYFDPPVTLQALTRHSNELIALSGGYKGPAGQLFLKSKTQQAIEFLKSMSSIFLDNFYIEISRQFLPDEIRTESFFVNYAVDNHVPLVATNEVFFLDKWMHSAQEVLMGISDRTYINQSDRRRTSEHAYLKTSEEMYELFADIPEAVINTAKIAKRCSYMPEPHDPMLPTFDNGSGMSEDEILKTEAIDGLNKRIQEGSATYTIDKDEYFGRLDYEYNVIKNMGFSGYFLIVSDFVKWAKTNGIPVGPGRGSGAGSIIAWSLYITDVDPIHYGLIFERFLNPDRVSMPDFDIDFCQYRRDEVIQYVKEKYGANNVAHIVALGKLQARAVIRDVGRVMQMPYGKVDRISKLIPHNPVSPVDLKKALEIEPAITNLMEEDESVKFLIETGLELEGLYRHASVHAAGVVIGQRQIDEIVPICKDESTDMAITQFNLKFVEKAGLVKFDFLGLKTLTAIKQACDLIDGGLDINKIPLDDAKTFEMLQSVNVIGVFQLESSGMRDVIQKLRPDRLEDIIALVSLYRPGPMDDIPKYLARKHGEEEVTYIHPLVEPILSATYGVMVYQEQVMKIAQVVGGYTLAASDLLRRAMGKKIVSEMVQHRKMFVAGAKKNGLSEGIANNLFSLMEKFAGYGFNKSHATPYALISYQTAYLKANYPIEFYIGTMNLDISFPEKIAIFAQDAKSNGIKILPPCINKSINTFKKEGDAIRYAIGAIRGSRDSVFQEVIDVREKSGEFKDIYDFFDRAPKKCLGKRQMDSLVMAGAFDSIHSNRNQVLHYFNCLPSRKSEETEVIQKSLFETSSSSSKICDMSHVQDMETLEKLEKERNFIGFYLTSHPMDVYSNFLGQYKITRSKDFSSAGYTATVAGILISKQEKLSKQNHKYAFIHISDQDNTFEVTVHPVAYKKTYNILKVGCAFVIDISIKNINGLMRISATAITDVSSILAKQKVFLELSEDASIDELQNTLELIEDGDNEISFVITPRGSPRKTVIETKYKKKLNLEAREKFLSIRGVKYFVAHT